MSSTTARLGNYRWTICALVFFATTVNYLDRNVLGLLKGPLAEAGVFGPTKAEQELNYSTVVICFQLAYAIGMLAAGRFIDWVGTKKGYAYSLIGWSFAAIGHAFGHHTWSFGFWRAALGVTEASNFPAANKTIAEWFPRRNGRWPRALQLGRQRRRHRGPFVRALHRRRLGLGVGLHPDRHRRPAVAENSGGAAMPRRPTS